MRRWNFAATKYLIAGAFVAGAFIATSGVVNADGMARKAAPAVQQTATSWSGLYFGVHSGWQWSSLNVENPAFPAGLQLSITTRRSLAGRSAYSISSA